MSSVTTGGDETPSRRSDSGRKTIVNTSPLDVTSEKQRRVFKIIVIGDSNVGKTCLSFRFCGGKFPSKTEATIGVDFREKTVLVDGEHVKLQLWDTAGQERFRKSMVPHYYRNVHAVVFVYDVTKSGSFESLLHWIDECNQHQLTSDVPRILVGNKCDCSETRVAVPTSVAQRFSDLHNMPLFETSAKDDSQSNHVEAIFMTLAHKLKNSRPMMVPPSDGNATTTTAGMRTSVFCQNYDLYSDRNDVVIGQRSYRQFSHRNEPIYEENCFC